MRKLFLILFAMLTLAIGSCQSIDNTNGMSPAFVRMPVRGTEITRTNTCNLSLQNNGSCYTLTVVNHKDTATLDLNLLSNIQREDGTSLYLFDKGQMVVEPVYSDSTMTETYVRDQFGDCIDTIYVPGRVYQYSMFKLTLFTDSSSPYEKITLLFDNI